MFKCKGITLLNKWNFNFHSQRKGYDIKEKYTFFVSKFNIRYQHQKVIYNLNVVMSNDFINACCFFFEKYKCVFLNLIKDNDFINRHFCRHILLMNIILPFSAC